MAKSDFCFTYYDGDATRDMSHMNRLERGAYTDLIISQRKFGHLTLDRIKKTLGKDFNECWESISVVLKQDQEQLYYIEWLEISERKAKKHAELQSEKRKGKTKREPDLTKQQPNETKLYPLEDGNGDGYENVSGLGKLEVFEKLFTDEIFVSELSSTHRGKDLKQAFEECYTHHSNAPNPPSEIWQWKQKLNTWLVIKSNGKRTTKNGANQPSISDLINSGFGNPTGAKG